MRGYTCRAMPFTHPLDTVRSPGPLNPPSLTTFVLHTSLPISTVPISGSNWASRQGFTDVSREMLKSRHVGSNGITNTKQVKLGVAEEAFAGILGVQKNDVLSSPDVTWLWRQNALQLTDTDHDAHDLVNTLLPLKPCLLSNTLCITSSPPFFSFPFPRPSPFFLNPSLFFLCFTLSSPSPSSLPSSLPPHHHSLLIDSLPPLRRRSLHLESAIRSYENRGKKGHRAFLCCNALNKMIQFASNSTETFI
jgi:hypothetical protein